MQLKLVLVLLLVVPTVLLGCSPKSTSALPAQEVLAKSISAMVNTTICSLSINTWESQTDFPSVGDKTPVTGIGPIWNITEISGNNGTKEITVNESYQEGFVITSFNLTAASGEWSLTQSAGAGGSNGSPVFTMNGSYDKWVPSDQYPQQINLMETAMEVSLLADETVNGIECYTLQIVPSKEAMINWVYSLEQPTDLSIGIGWWGGIAIAANRTTEIYYDAYDNSSSVTVWVSQSSYQVVRINVSALFEVLPQYLRQSEFSGSFQEVSPNATCNATSCGYFYKYDRAFYNQVDFANCY